MKTQQKSEQTIQKYFVPSIILLLIVIAVLIWTMANMTTNVKIDKKTTEKNQIQKKNDSLSVKRTEEITKIIDNSQANAVRADHLIKKLPNEKTIIRDTTYAAMCEYITNYRPE